MKINWQLYGLIRVAIMFIGGIIVADVLGDKLFINPLHTLIFFIGCYLGTSFVSMPMRGVCYSVLLLATFLVLGYYSYMINDPRDNPAHFSNKEEYTSFVGTLIEYPKTRTRSKTVFRVTSVCYQGECNPAIGDLLLYFPKNDSIAANFEPGVKLIISGNYTPVAKPANPNTFNFQSYLYYRKMHYQMLLKETDSYRVLAVNDLPLFQLLAHRSRAKLLEILSYYITDNDRYAVAAAMMLGYRNQLDNSLYEKFTNSGAVHVLAVSGLHVGIVCFIFYMLLDLWKSKSLRTKIIKFIILTSVVWSYATMTGAAPAVLRAATMFTIFLIGKYWFNYYKAYNIMAFTALGMLIYDPYLLFQASFQFSFISLSSIIYFQPIIGKLYHSKNWLAKNVWNMTNVAMAAQVLVFPITIYFFHKFPTYFIITGILAVPAAIVILCFGMALIGFSWVPFLSDLLAFILNKLLALFIGIISLIDSLPMSSIGGVWISLLEMLALYLLLASLVVYIESKNVFSMNTIGICTLILLSSFVINDYQTKNQNSVVIYDSYKGSLIDIFCGNTVYTYTSKNLEDTDLSFVAKNHREFRAYKSITDVFKERDYASDIKVTQNVVQIENVTIAFVSHDTDFICKNLDYLILYDKSKSKPNGIELDKKTVVIIDSTIDKYTRSQWMEYCMAHKMKCLSTIGESVNIDL